MPRSEAAACKVQFEQRLAPRLNQIDEKCEDARLRQDGRVGKHQRNQSKGRVGQRCPQYRYEMTPVRQFTFNVAEAPAHFKFSELECTRQYSGEKRVKCRPLVVRVKPEPAELETSQARHKLRGERLQDKRVDPLVHLHPLECHILELKRRKVGSLALVKQFEDVVELAHREGTVLYR